MEREELLELGAQLGYELMLSGAEIYRTEDSVGRLLRAYGEDSGEVFAIPNCLTVSLGGEGGAPLTRIRRVPAHGTDVDRLERCNALCRELCQKTPGYAQAMERLEALRREARGYTPLMALAGYWTGGFGFCLFFGGGALNGAVSGLCCLAIGLCLHMLGRVGANPFFKTAAASAAATFLAILAGRLGSGLDADVIAIGALMALVPGVCFTGAMRDLMAGDMVTGLSRCAEGLLIGGAIVMGTGAAMAAARLVWGG